MFSVCQKIMLVAHTLTDILYAGDIEYCGKVLRMYRAQSTSPHLAQRMSRHLVQMMSVPQADRQLSVIWTVLTNTVLQSSEDRCQTLLANSLLCPIISKSLKLTHLTFSQTSETKYVLYTSMLHLSPQCSLSASCTVHVGPSPPSRSVPRHLSAASPPPTPVPNAHFLQTIFNVI